MHSPGCFPPSQPILGSPACRAISFLTSHPRLEPVAAIIFAGWFLKKAFISRPAAIMLIGSCTFVFFTLLGALPASNKVGIYVSVTLGRFSILSGSFPFGRGGVQP